MSGQPRAIVLDSSVLINFLRIGRVDLLTGLPLRFVVTTHVAAEISDGFPKQREQFEAALATGAVEQHDVVEAAAIGHFGRLWATGRLGAGECAAIAYCCHERFRPCARRPPRRARGRSADARVQDPSNG